jgi:TIGR00730 family protein
MNKKVAIFCGSAFGNDPLLPRLSIEAAELLAKNHFDLVYGGGYRGLMGQIAEAFKNNRAAVYGVLPELFNNDKVKLKDVHTKLIVTRDMHERKATMYGLADAFAIFPGGIGTFDEFFEIYTWRQLGLHKKQVVIYNINGFYDTLLSFLDEVTGKGFMSRQIREALLVANTKEELIECLAIPTAEVPSKI